jgi:hypothetical protein
VAACVQAWLLRHRQLRLHKDGHMLAARQFIDALSMTRRARSSASTCKLLKTRCGQGLSLAGAGSTCCERGLSCVWPSSRCGTTELALARRLLSGSAQRNQWGAGDPVSQTMKASGELLVERPRRRVDEAGLVSVQQCDVSKINPFMTHGSQIRSAVSHAIATI